MYPVPTELRSIGYLTIIFDPKSKSNMLVLRKNNLPTICQKALSPVMSGTTFSVCSTAWTSQSFHAAISAQPVSLRPCLEGWYRKKDQEKKNAWLHNQRPMRNLVSKIVDKSPTALRSSTSYSPETLKAKSSSLDLTSTGKPAASSSQVRQLDVNSSVSAGKLAAETTKNSVGQNDNVSEQRRPPWESLLKTYGKNWVVTQTAVERAVNSKGIRFLRFRALFRRQNCWVPTVQWRLGKTKLRGSRNLQRIVNWTV